MKRHINTITSSLSKGENSSYNESEKEPGNITILSPKVPKVLQSEEDAAPSEQIDSSPSTHEGSSDDERSNNESSDDNRSDEERDNSKYFVELSIEPLENQEDQTSEFCLLPEEILLKLFEFLSIPDLIAMATTCKWIAKIFSRNFVFKMVQPRPLSSLKKKKVNGRYLLSLTHDFDVTYGKERWKNAYLERIELLTSIELKRLQRLTVDAYEACFGLDLPFTKLPLLYFEIVSHYLSNARNLTHLHISLDKSKKSFDTIDTIVETLPNLKNIALNAAFFPDEDEINVEESKIVYENGDAVTHSTSSSMTLNSLLKRLLENPSIRSLEVKGLIGITLTDNQYPLKICSPTLQFLKLEHNEFGYFKDLVCPELREFKHVNLKHNPGKKLKCLVHHDPFADDMSYAALIIEDCPKLEVINGIDLKRMKSCMVDPKSVQEWHSQFEEMCDCEKNPSARGAPASIPFFI